MDSGLQDTSVLITGASGGIGLALVQAFYDEGANLTLHANRNLAGLQATARQHGWDERRLHFVAGDVRDPALVSEFFTQAATRFGTVDVAVANAGIWPADDARLDELSPERIRDVIETNLLGKIWTARAFMQTLAASKSAARDGKGASLCFIGSTAGRFGEAGHSDYAASKAALRGLMLSLKNELTAIDPFARVNMVDPGWTATAMAAETLADSQVVDRCVATMALRQLARPQDIARAVLFLSSPRLAGHISGESLCVAGGMEGRLLWQPHQIDAQAVRARLLQPEV